MNLLLSLFPHASAQGLSSVTQVEQTGKLISAINTNIVSTIGVLLLALTVIAFFAGMVRFIWAIREGEEKKATEGKRFMLWSLLAVFVVFSIYGIIIFMQMTLLGKRAETTIDKPCLNFVNDCPKSNSTYSPQGGNPNSGGTPSSSGGTPSSNGGFGTGTTGGGTQTPQGACIGKVGNDAPCVLNGNAGTCQVVNASYVCIPSGSSGTQTSSGQCSSATYGKACQILGKNGTCQYDDSNGGYYCSSASTGSPASAGVTNDPTSAISACSGKEFDQICDFRTSDRLSVSGRCAYDSAVTYLYCDGAVSSKPVTGEEIINSSAKLETYNTNNNTCESATDVGLSCVDVNGVSGKCSNMVGPDGIEYYCEAP